MYIRPDCDDGFTEAGSSTSAVVNFVELRADLDLLLRRHLGELVEVVARSLDQWHSDRGLYRSSTKGMVFALISIIRFHHPLPCSFSFESAGPQVAFEVSVAIFPGGLEPRSNV